MKYRLQSILFVFVAFMLGCNEYMIVGVLPDIAHQYHDSLSTLGLLVTVFALVYAIFTPIITSLANRWRRHHVLLVLMVVFFIGNTWTALASNFISMLFSRVLTATVAGAIISIVLVMASFVAPREKRASLVSWVFAGFSIASVIGIPIGTVISTTFSWHDSFWMISGLTIFVFVSLIWLVPKDTPQFKSTLSKQFTLLKDTRVLLGVVFIVTVCAADYTIYTYIRPLITNEMGFSNTWLNWLLFGMGIFFIIGNKFGGYIADNGGIHRLGGIYIAMTILYLLFGPLLSFKWIAIIIVALLCIAFSSYGSSTQLMFLDIAEKEYPQSLDLASSLNSIFANIGISLGSFTASQAVAFLPMRNLGYVGAVYGLAATILVLVLSKKYTGMRF
ncbi:MFS transporter [Limosilactobacillus vaginalis]|jgi:DHA1 family inner membrane transport protein|uniref:MFS transporter n=2 Tax=Limosilactobacillus vaginalis TaxID=1633 RepID=A0AAP3GFL2_9LACO|nr:MULTISPECIES: MFS transporter [Limosilactobacillus]PEH05285.1 MFS transporter [Lactobacillus sp. UMNPBX5]EEJ40346.1 transporter, major facilitator family protein [Limosilactobacillus vaginalis DSM 5837 = ATCC 49540]KRM48124.1 major facilitator superfamily MFS 1 transporter [Limosilactobacillus vaginalis DSM 5837 = ATCC 49540]MCI6853423.1 MFS transporter [Limosilactobacillus vaginalis]MCZ2466375.1 MFS transporter [Limosilactobacillus vaginalis]